MIPEMIPLLRSLIACFSLLALAWAPLPAQRTTPAPAPVGVRPIDWPALAEETTRIMAGYLKIDTSNLPGNELAGALYLKDVLEREGIEAQILDTAALGTGRANIYARIKGNGSKKAIALVHHIDVVPATPSFWTVPPFSGEIRDGFLWGRGALDMKGHGIAQLMAMIALKRSGVPLNRDIVFIGNADEELGSTGAVVFVRDHPELIRDVEYLLTEKTLNDVRDGKLVHFSIGVAEKRTFWQRLTVQGVPSHGSMPTKQNPVPRLVAAVHRLGTFETPLEVTPGVERYFRDIARTYDEPQRSWLSDVRRALDDSTARAWILDNSTWNAYLRITIAPTVLAGSNKTNVIPPEASAEVDVRILPHHNRDTVLAMLKRVVNDTAVHFTTLIEPKAPLESPLESPVVRAIERAALERRPDLFVTTPLLNGATDRPTYQAAGILTYAVDPFLVDVAEDRMGVHGNNERISLENIGFGVKYLYDILRYIQ